MINTWVCTPAAQPFHVTPQHCLPGTHWPVTISYRTTCACELPCQSSTVIPVRLGICTLAEAPPLIALPLLLIYRPSGPYLLNCKTFSGTLGAAGIKRHTYTSTPLGTSPHCCFKISWLGILPDFTPLYPHSTLWVTHLLPGQGC